MSIDRTNIPRIDTLQDFITLKNKVNLSSNTLDKLNVFENNVKNRGKLTYNGIKNGGTSDSTMKEYLINYGFEDFFTLMFVDVCNTVITRYIRENNIYFLDEYKSTLTKRYNNIINSINNGFYEYNQIYENNKKILNKTEYLKDFKIKYKQLHNLLLSGTIISCLLIISLFFTFKNDNNVFFGLFISFYIIVTILWFVFYFDCQDLNDELGTLKNYKDIGKLINDNLDIFNFTNHHNQDTRKKIVENIKNYLYNSDEFNYYAKLYDYGLNEYINIFNLKNIDNNKFNSLVYNNFGIIKIFKNNVKLNNFEDFNPSKDMNNYIDYDGKTPLELLKNFKNGLNVFNSGLYIYLYYSSNIGEKDIVNHIKLNSNDGLLKNIVFDDVDTKILIHGVNNDNLSGYNFDINKLYINTTKNIIFNNTNDLDNINNNINKFNRKLVMNPDGILTITGGVIGIIFILSACGYRYYIRDDKPKSKDILQFFIIIFGIIYGLGFYMSTYLGIKKYNLNDIFNDILENHSMSKL